jgi:arginyl-tRNA synthetase
VTPDAVSAAVLDVVRATFVAHDLDTSALPETTTVERPRNRDHGDYATTIALQLSKRVGVPPRELAGWIGERLGEQPGIASAEVAGPGFLNIRLEAAAAGQLAQTIVEAGAAYGRVDLLAGQHINVEFVSANPTGPVHLGHTRWAAVGDVLARVFEAAGAEVAREFYINDRGAQITNFGKSLVAAALGEPTPENGYHGEYVADIARAIVADRPEILDLPEDERLTAFREEGYRRQLDEQKAVLGKFRTHFDVWFSERSLHSSGAIEDAMAELRKAGHVYEQDGAVWMRTSEFGDDKDRPLIKSDGEYTYFGSDAAYYVNKRSRGFNRCLYLLGADHHGYVNRLRAIAACAGDNPDDSVDVLIGQLVKVMQNGAEMKLSKRAGTIITLQEVVDLVGVDAARYQLSRFSTDSEMVLDVDLLNKRTNDNPVYYVQYAHARICSILESWGGDVATLVSVDLAPLSSERAGAVLQRLADYPGMLTRAAAEYAPHAVAFYARDLASDFHGFYNAERVLVDDRLEREARLALLLATRQVLRNALGVLGLSAPERM